MLILGLRKNIMENKVYANNKKAQHDYFLEKRIEAGLELKGTEVKSIRQGKVNLKESYCMFKGNELFVIGMHVSPYKEGNRYNLDPLRDRKLLLSKKQLLNLKQQHKLESITIIPVSIYSSAKYIKLEIAVARGKKLYDKRESMKIKDINRNLSRNKINF